MITKIINRNRRGEHGYLAQDGIHWVQNVHTWVGAERVEIGLHEGWINGVHVVCCETNLCYDDSLTHFHLDLHAQYSLLPSYLPNWKPTIPTKGNCTDGKGSIGIIVSLEAHSCSCYYQ